MLSASHLRSRTLRRGGFTLLEVLVVVAIIIILATVASVAVIRNIDDAKKNSAQLKAKNLQTAMEAYYANPSSGNVYPTSWQELIQPHWGGSSFLKDPINDILDPWGQEYRIGNANTDGSIQGVPLVYTIAPDGTPISQFGVGPEKSRLQ